MMRITDCLTKPYGRLDESLSQMFGLSNSLATGYLAIETLTNTSGVEGYVDAWSAARRRVLNYDTKA